MIAQRETTQPPPDEKFRSHRGRHGWMMIACCIPMLAIAIALVATGTASPGFLFVAIGCTVMLAVMMALMMAGMDHGSDHCGARGRPYPCSARECGVAS